MDLNQLVKSAQNSKFGKWKLNFILKRVIPFNKPHNIEVSSMDNHHVKVSLPYKRSNLNHLKGLHACALATAAEFASGLLLLNRLGAKKYRLIMESIQVSYHYQGKTNAIASFTMEEEEFQKEIMEPLNREGVCFKACKIDLNDIQGNLLCTVTTNWQIKIWEKVKTKMV